MRMEKIDSPQGPLRALRPIKTVGNGPPFRIVSASLLEGTARSAEDLMASKVKWANKAGFRVLSHDVSADLLPYNAIIRVNARGTEDEDLDYLAHLVVDGPTAD